MKSNYNSGKSVAKNKNISIAADDPRLSWDQEALTRARSGAEIDVIGLDGRYVVAGGTTPNNPTANPINENIYEPSGGINIPAIGGREPSFYPADTVTPTALTNVIAEWSGNDLIVTFDWEYDNDLNSLVSSFILEITAEGVTRQTRIGAFLPNKTQTEQTITFTKALNELTFGAFTVDITSVCVFSIDPLYNTSESACAPEFDPWVLDLPVPVITVTAILNGYKVEYTKPTNSIFDAIEIVEYESNASTEPTGVTYVATYWDSVTPAVIIAANQNPRWVKARFSSGARKWTAYSAAQKVTPTSPVTIDNVGPADVTSVSATTGIDTSGYLGFNGYADITWPAVSDSTLRGYRIRFSNDGGTTYTYANSPGTGTTYRLGGLAIGSTYKIAVATYDELNNTSTNYVSISPDVVIAGTPSVSNYITAGPFQFGVGVGGVSTNKGLYFDSSNYWYINSSDSARLKVGGDLSNYLLWDGATFAIDGDITARGGYFAGNVGVVLGGSIYSGTLGVGGITGAGYILNSNGLIFNSSTVDGITEITAGTGLFTTTNASIGGWTINDKSITKTTTGQGKIDINSAEGYISVTNTSLSSYYSGINAPTANTDSVFWAGIGTKIVGGITVADPNSSSNAFRVTLGGNLYAINADIKGIIKATSGGIGTFNTSNQLTSGWQIGASGLTAVGSGAKITVGNYSIMSNSENDFTIYDDTLFTSILTTNSVASATDPKRIYLGDLSRQVEVAKSAQISGAGSTATLPTNDVDDVSAYRSGGLRNMFTVASGELYEDGFGSIGSYPSAIKGDVLIVWDPNDPNSRSDNPWRKISAMYLNTKGVSGQLYYYGQYILYEGTCDQAPSSPFTTYNLPAGYTIPSGQTVGNVYLSYGGGGYYVYSVYSSLSAEDAINALIAHATAAGNACATSTGTTTTTTTTPSPTSYKRCTEFDVANSLCGPSDFNLCDSGGCASGADCTGGSNRCYVE